MSFKKPKVAKPDDSELKAAQAKAAREAAELEAQQKEEEAARARGRRGKRSLMGSDSYGGYLLGSAPNSQT